MRREDREIAVQAQVRRVLVLGAPRDDEQRAALFSEMAEALGSFLLPDIESGVTQLVRNWSRGRGWPLPSDVVAAVGQARRSRLSDLPREEQPRIDPNAVCRCGAVPRDAWLARPRGGGVMARVIAPCNETWHRSRKQGWVPTPAGFLGWCDEVSLAAAEELLARQGEDVA